MIWKSLNPINWGFSREREYAKMCVLVGTDNRSYIRHGPVHWVVLAGVFMSTSHVLDLIFLNGTYVWVHTMPIISDGIDVMYSGLRIVRSCSFDRIFEWGGKDPIVVLRLGELAGSSGSDHRRYGGSMPLCSSKIPVKGPAYDTHPAVTEGFYIKKVNIERSFVSKKNRG